MPSTFQEEVDKDKSDGGSNGFGIIQWLRRLLRAMGWSKVQDEKAYRAETWWVEGLAALLIGAVALAVAGVGGDGVVQALQDAGNWRVFLGWALGFFVAGHVLDIVIALITKSGRAPPAVANTGWSLYIAFVGAIPFLLISASAVVPPIGFAVAGALSLALFFGVHWDVNRPGSLSQRIVSHLFKYVPQNVVPPIGFAGSRGTLSTNQPISGGLCVTGDTLWEVIRREENERIVRPTRIKDVRAGERVMSLNERTRKVEPHRVKALMFMGVKPIFRLTTSGGRTIRTTANHPYLTWRDGEAKWVKVSDLEPGDPVAAPESWATAASYSNSTKEPSNIANRFVLREASGILPNRSERAAFILSRCLELMRIRMMPAWEDVGYRSASEKSMSWVMRILESAFAWAATPASSVPFVTGTASWPRERRKGIRFEWQFSSARKRMPMGSHEGGVVSSGFDRAGGELQGGFDVIGRQTGVGLSYFRKSRPLLQHIENEVNHDAGAFKARFPVTNGRIYLDVLSDIHILTITRLLGTVKNAMGVVGGAFGGLVPPAHAAALTPEEPAGSDVAWERIAAIEALPPEPVWDIEVEGTHNFIGNGIFAHNTAIGPSRTPVGPLSVQSQGLTPVATKSTSVPSDRDRLNVWRMVTVLALAGVALTWSGDLPTWVREASLALSLAALGWMLLAPLFAPLVRRLWSRGTLSTNQPISGGLCVTGDTLWEVIRREENERIVRPTRIKDVRAGDRVMSLNERTRKVEPHRVKALMFGASGFAVGLPS